MIDLIEKYIHCEYIEPKEAVEYIFEYTKKFVEKEIQNKIVDLHDNRGNQWYRPPEISFKNKIPYSEKWMKSFIWHFERIRLNIPAISKIVNNIEWQAWIIQGYKIRYNSNKWINGIYNLCIAINYWPKKDNI